MSGHVQLALVREAAEKPTYGKCRAPPGELWLAFEDTADIQHRLAGLARGDALQRITGFGEANDLAHVRARLHLTTTNQTDSPPEIVRVVINQAAQQAQSTTDEPQRHDGHRCGGQSDDDDRPAIGDHL